MIVSELPERAEFVFFNNHLSVIKIIFNRPVAQFGRASVSKTEGWGFDSLLACFEAPGVEAR